MNNDDIDNIIVQLQALKLAPPKPPGSAAEWKERALKAETQLQESRRTIDLLVGEIAALRDALTRRLAP